LEQGVACVDDVEKLLWQSGTAHGPEAAAYSASHNGYVVVIAHI
jgi:hypothetical protein